MLVSRRKFLQAGAAGVAGASLLNSLWAGETAAEKAGKIRVSAREGSFGGNLEAAAKCNLDGVELYVGDPAAKLHLADPEVRKKLKEQLKSLGLAVSSLSMDFFNEHPLVSDPQAPAWIEQTIEAAKDLQAAGILLPFFGRGELKPADYDALIARMKAAAPKPRPRASSWDWKTGSPRNKIWKSSTASAATPCAFGTMSAIRPSADTTFPPNCKSSKAASV